MLAQERSEAECVPVPDARECLPVVETLELRVRIDLAGVG